MTPTRSGRVRVRNVPRHTANWTRAYGSAERVAWVAAMPCAVCLRPNCENAHVRSGGTGRKADACWIVPLCPLHHAELHRGAKTFQAKYRIDVLEEATITEARWQRHELRTGGNNDGF